MSASQICNEELIKVLKSLVLKLTNTDGSDMSEVTRGISEASNHPQFVQSLVFLCKDADIQVRQSSALLLRRKLRKSWKSLSEAIRLELRKELLKQLTEESEKIVARALMQVIGQIALREYESKRSWNEMMTLINEACLNADQNVVQVGVELLCVVCETVNFHLDGLFEPIIKLLLEILSNPNVNVDSAAFAVRAFKALIPYLGSDVMALVLQIIPKCVEVTRMVLTADESHATDMLETFECLVESEVAFITPHIKDVVLFALEIASSTCVEEETIVRAFSVVHYVISMKKKAILKHNLIDSILNVIWPIVLESNVDDEDVGLIGDESDCQTPFSSSLQIVDEMALNLPPAKLFEKMLPRIHAAAQSNRDEHKRGILLVLACLTEGTSEYIKENHMRAFVTFACEGAISENEKLRNAAMFAIGQYAEFLEPEICKYADEVMPVLFGALEKATNCRGLGVARAYYALENFVENLDEELDAWLHRVMEYLKKRMQTTDDIKEKTFVISTLGSLGSAAKDKLGPYMNDVMQMLQFCLQTMKDSEEIQAQAFDTLGVFVRVFGKENLELAQSSLKLGIDTIERGTDDPEMKRAAYGLFAAISTVLEEKLEQFLPQIVPTMLKSISSNEGLVELGAGDAGADLSFLNDGEDDDEDAADLEDEEDSDAFHVGSLYMDEKIEACSALGDLAKHSKHAFVQYLPMCFDELRKKCDFAYPEVRKAAISSCGQMVMTAYQLAGEMYPTFLEQTFEFFCTTILEDVERVVVMSALFTMKELILTCGTDLFAKNDQDLHVLVQIALKVFNQQCKCQDADEDDDGDDEDQQQGEYDEMLIEYCGELFPVLAEKIGPSFAPYFKVCAPFFVSKLKPSSSTTERAMAAGTLAETFQKFGGDSASYIVPEVLPKLINIANDKTQDVRNNAIFGIGIFMQYCDDATARAAYPSALNCLSQSLTNESKRFVVDNILSAVCRMITSHNGLVPLKQVLPVLLSRLPIEEDHSEDESVYGCLVQVIRHPDVIGEESLRNGIARALAHACGHNDVSMDVRHNIELALKKLVEDGIVTQM